MNMMRKWVMPENHESCLVKKPILAIITTSRTLTLTLVTSLSFLNSSFCCLERSFNSLILSYKFDFSISLNLN